MIFVIKNIGRRSRFVARIFLKFRIGIKCFFKKITNFHDFFTFFDNIYELFMYQTADYTYLFAPDVPVERNFFIAAIRLQGVKPQLSNFLKSTFFYKKLNGVCAEKNNLYLEL